MICQPVSGLTFVNPETGGHIIYLMKVTPETGGHIIYLMKVSLETDGNMVRSSFLLKVIVLSTNADYPIGCPFVFFT
jgi:hypothetical protein